MSYHPYESYSQPEVDWLDEMPSHWEIRRTKTMLSLQKSKVGRAASEYTLLSLTLGGVVPRVISEGGKFPAEFDTYQKVEPGDLVFCLFDIDETPRTIGIARDDGMITGAYNVYRTLPPCVPQYAYYYFLHIDSFKGLRPFYTGLRKVVRADTFSKIEIPAPPLEEQTQIAKFLDYETAKIDALLAKQQQLIALLQEKRQAVISHAVTKGLKPAAPLRDSGVEWLGQVPAHWTVVALKHLVAVPIIDGPHETPIKRDEGIPFVSAESVSKGFINFDKIWGYISQEDHARYSKRYKPQLGDILMVKLGATTGVVAIVETEKDFNVWVPLAVIRPKRGIKPRFIFHVLRSDNLKNAYQINWTYGTQQTLGLRTISNLRLPIPPEQEMQEIVEYLDSILPLFESLSTKAEAAVELLQERRTALIAAAVTGKIDVRGWQPPPAAVEEESITEP